MTNKELLAVAMQQSALDLNCAPEDFFMILLENIKLM